MALIVETGAGLANAESYISVADATARHASLGNAAWAALASDTIREQLLRKATEYIEGAYLTRWKGVRKLSTQALSWPRSYVYVDGQYEVSSLIVPNEVKNACADLALKAATAELSPDISRQEKIESIGPISVTYADSAKEYTKYRAIDLMLAKYLDGIGGASIRLVANG